MKFVLLTIVAAVIVSSHAKTLNMDKVVRALDALYKRQSPSPTPTQPWTQSWTPSWGPTDYYGSGSNERSGSDEESCSYQNSEIMYMLDDLKDNMFFDKIRSSFVPMNAACHDLVYWLMDHRGYEEAEEAGSGSVPTPSSSGKFRKRNVKANQIKRSLKALKAALEKRQGGGSWSGRREQLDDRDIEWHRIYITCYMWTHIGWGEFAGRDGSGSGSGSGGYSGGSGDGGTTGPTPTP